MVLAAGLEGIREQLDLATHIWWHRLKTRKSWRWALRRRSLHEAIGHLPPTRCRRPSGRVHVQRLCGVQTCGVGEYHNRL